MRRMLTAALLLVVCVAGVGLPRIAAAAEAVATTTLVKVSGGQTASSPFPYGEPLYFRAEVTAADGTTPTGDVRLYQGAALVHEGPLFGGALTIQVAPDLGTSAMSAQFVGSAGYGASTASPVDIEVVKAPTLTSILSSDPGAGDWFDISLAVGVDVQGFSGSRLPTGSLVLRRDGVEVARYPARSATHRHDGLPAGTYTFTLSYEGDDTFLPSASAKTVEVYRHIARNGISSSAGGSNFNCAPGSTCTVPTSPTNKPLTFYSSVIPDDSRLWGRDIGGVVTFFMDGVPLGTAPVVNGTAELTVQDLPVGRHWFEAQFHSSDYFKAPDGNPTMLLDITQAVYPRNGYWMLDSSGKAYAFGNLRRWGDASHALKGAATFGVGAVDIEPSRTGSGYWIADNIGRVFAFGDAPALGGAPSGSLRPGEWVTSLSATGSGNGYWLFTTAGRVIAIGDAVHRGDVSHLRLNGPVLDSIPTPSGNGYYMVAADGGIFTFGDAVFRGSMGNALLNAPVQSLVPDPDGAGYWLVASDGGIFAFDAPFRGSLGGMRLNRPVTGMVGSNAGYLMVAEDGGIFAFGEAPFFGSLGDRPPPDPVVAVAPFFES